jgi:hypothetical protein
MIFNWKNEKTYLDIAGLIKVNNYYGNSLDFLLEEDLGLKEYLGK